MKSYTFQNANNTLDISKTVAKTFEKFLRYTNLGTRVKIEKRLFTVEKS